MLQFLRISNLALLDQVELELDRGFTAVTGETGAGKSVLLGALRLLSGARADKGIIRQGAETCEVEGALCFENPAEVNGLLDEMGLPPCEEGVLLLKRVLPRDKMARVTVNGSLTTLSNLQRIGEVWIDFHGPDDPQKLFQTAAQLDLLDLYAQNAPALQEYRLLFEEWGRVGEKREEIASAGKLSEEEVQFYRNQIEKIDQCEVSEESIGELERSFNRLSRGQELTQSAQNLAESLNGDDGVYLKLGALQRLARELEEIDPSTGMLRERLVALTIEAEDLGQEFQKLAGEFDLEPEEAERVMARMNLWLELQRKMGGSIEAVLEKRAEMADRLEQQGDIEGTLAKLDRQASEAEKRLRGMALALREGREKAACDLSARAVKAIAALGFKRSGFEARVTPEEKLSLRGGSHCQFFFSPNAGQELAPLHKIASSGEIARVMLALKTVLARIDSTPVLVFDEVDANVGGEIGRIVGERMADLGERHQVFCVTHLPQVASLARHHLVVEKQQADDATAVTITAVHENRSGRIGELARMLGDRRAKSARAHAEELLGS